MRSKLFVPGARSELFEKALASDADGLAFDLEDAVTHDCKSGARASVAAFLRERMAQAAQVVAEGPAFLRGAGLQRLDVERIAREGLQAALRQVRVPAQQVEEAHQSRGLPRSQNAGRF